MFEICRSLASLNSEWNMCRVIHAQKLLMLNNFVIKRRWRKIDEKKGEVEKIKTFKIIQPTKRYHIILRIIFCPQIAYLPLTHSLLTHWMLCHQLLLRDKIKKHEEEKTRRKY